MPVIVNGVKLRCSCGNTERFSINNSTPQVTNYTCQDCGTTQTIRH